MILNIYDFISIYTFCTAFSDLKIINHNHLKNKK